MNIFESPKDVQIKKFYGLIDRYIDKKKSTPRQVALLAGFDQSVLVPSKTIKTGRFLGFYTFIKVCNALEISPVKFMKEYEKELKRR